MWDKTYKLDAGKRGRQSNWVVNYRGLCSGVDFQVMIQPNGIQFEIIAD